MRKILQNMGLKITEISEIMEISRPTMYKFMDMYEKGEKENIDANVLKFLERVERNPKMQKRDALYYALLVQGSKGRLEPQEENVKKIVTVTIVERPARKLLLLRSKNAVDYMSYCEEMGCDWENVMNAFERRFDDAAIVTLPKKMVLPRTSEIAAGVELQTGDLDIPKGYELTDLPPCTMLYMNGSPYLNEEHFCEAIEIVNDALVTYDPEIYGWKFDHENGLSFNFGASAKKGARIAVPVKRI